MNLIHDRWIPAKRADGKECVIAPWEIGHSDNPVVKITAPRPDFRGALYQFLIGLVQTAFAPEDDEEWKERWDNPPSCDDLKAAFNGFTPAFELINENGPAFMQDYSISELKGEKIHVKELLFEIAGNPEHFVKHSSVNVMCESCAATALFSLQTNAPEGGRGHRTGMRGGGPLTTIIKIQNENEILWKRIWINILSIEELNCSIPISADPNVFPWMSKTRVSKNDIKTYPEDVHKLQMYWGLPRRIRLIKGTENKTCNICGNIGIEIEGFYMEGYGVCYGPSWIHLLSPYRTNKEKDGNLSQISLKGKQGGYSYPDWLQLTIGIDNNEKNARVVESFNIHKRLLENIVLWCYGYDMKQMKARNWYDQTMPLLEIKNEKKEDFIKTIYKIIEASEDTSKILQDQIKSAWFDRPGDKKGNTNFIRSAFWEETEDNFYLKVFEVRDTLESGKQTKPILQEWFIIITNMANKLFDRYALQETDEPKNMKRVAEAEKVLNVILNSPKTKSLANLK